jgi:solute carrier family 24 (sodium/potassium/calcium exchanger), member 6
VFLFSVIGISASRFFCPNLATIAKKLDLGANVAGVTFLALGNGSPDVFRAFPATRVGPGALEIEVVFESADFIVSIVAGTKRIIRLLSVEPRPSLCDVGFFAAAVVVILPILWDKRIWVWDAQLLIALCTLCVFGQGRPSTL